MIKNKKLIFFSFLVALFFIASCAPAEKTPQGISIGAILSLTNNDPSLFHNAMREGIELAVEEINANGGVLGRPVRVLYEDDQLDNTKAVTAAEKLVNVNKVVASLGGAVNTAKATGATFQRAKIPLVVLWDANHELEKIGDQVFGIGFDVEAAGTNMADFLYKKGARTVGVIRHQDEFSQLSSNAFVTAFTELGGTVIADESLTIDAVDFRTSLLKMKDADAIYAPLVGHIDVWLKQAQELHYTGLRATADGMSDDTINAAPQASEGVFFTQVFVQDNKKLDALKQAYNKKYSKEPELLIFNALGYDGILLLAQAIRQAGSTEPEKIQKALLDIKNLEGAAGAITINEKRASPKTERIFQVQNGTMVLLESPIT